MNLVDLIESDGVRLTRYGKSYRGRCPWHNGKTETSLLVDTEAGKFHCFGCDRHGDAIDWLRERRGISFLEACQYLGHEPERMPKAPRPAPSKWEPREAKAPADKWESKARTFLDRAVDCLWTRQGKEMWAWLQSEKGLSDATIKAACLGFNPADIYEPREAWGLPDSLKEDGTKRRLWIPAGLVIPLVDEGRIIRLRIRRPEGEPRYVLIPGSDTRPMTWGLKRPAVAVVESELDGLLLNQEAGDLAGVVAMGTAKAKPDRATHEVLKQMEMILVSLDTDEAGTKASWQFWPSTYGKRAKRWPCVNGKDPSEARQNGLDLRDWIVTGVFTTFERFERFCIQTVDGGLTDYEALKVMAR